MKSERVGKKQAGKQTAKALQAVSKVKALNFVADAQRLHIYDVCDVSGINYHSRDRSNEH